MTDSDVSADEQPEINADGAPPNPMVVDCNRCERSVLAVPDGHTFFQEPEGGPMERWTLVHCKPAWHPMLVLQEEYGEPTRFDDDDPTRMYPPRTRRLSTAIPPELREGHVEAQRCLKAKAYTAAVVMAGKTLDIACKLHGIEKGTLEAKLEKMRDQGLIDGRLWEWSDTLRGVRNAATHDAPANISRQDAEDAVALSEALLDYLYIFTARFNAMKARRDGSKAAPGLDPSSPLGLVLTVAQSVVEAKNPVGGSGRGANEPAMPES